MNIITHLQKRLESILDNDHEQPNAEVVLAKKNFEALTDPRLLRGLAESLPHDSADKAVILFSRLALYFDAGVFLELDGSLWEPQAHFHKGQVGVLKPHQKKQISLPQVELMTILRTDAKPVLAKLHLQNLDHDQKTICLLLRPAQDYAFLLFSSLPDLWLRDHTKHVVEAIHHGLFNE